MSKCTSPACVIYSTCFFPDKCCEKNKPAEPVANAPVAWLDEFGNVFPLGAWVRSEVREKWKPLYTEPAANAAQPAPAAVPPGYALVPIEPTHGMLSALTQEWHPSKHGPMKQRYRAMIAAAGDNT